MLCHPALSLPPLYLRFSCFGSGIGAWRTPPLRTKAHEYLIKWKGYIPQKSSWEKVAGVNAPAAVKKYTDELQQRIDYAKGVTTTLDKAAADAGGGSLTLDPEAWDDADAAVLSLMTEVDDRTLTFVPGSGLWTQRLAFSEG